MVVYDFDILMLNETHLKESYTIVCPVYTCYMGTMGLRAVELVVCIKQDFKLNQVDVRD